MKSSLVTVGFGLAVGAALCGAALPLQPRSITFGWDPPTNGAPDTYYLYSAQTLASQNYLVLTNKIHGVTQWTWFTNVAGCKWYAVTNVADPALLPKPGAQAAQWTAKTSIPGSATNYTMQVDPGCYFFCLTASNFWGESDFSPGVGTPPMPIPGNQFGVRLN